MSRHTPYHVSPAGEQAQKSRRLPRPSRHELELRRAYFAADPPDWWKRKIRRWRKKLERRRGKRVS